MRFYVVNRTNVPIHLMVRRHEDRPDLFIFTFTMKGSGRTDGAVSAEEIRPQGRTLIHCITADCKYMIDDKARLTFGRGKGPNEQHLVVTGLLN